MSTASGLLPRWKAAPRLVQANIVLLFLVGTAYSILLFPEWLHDPDLSHGLFMPVLFVFALVASSEGPARYLPTRAWPLTLLFGMGCVAVTATAGLYAAAVGWSNSLVTFLLGVGFALLCLSVLASIAVRGIELLPINWSSVVACGLWILCAPIPPGSYSRLSLSLQLGITGGVIRCLHLLGVAAHQSGNVIELADASVGIEDACSGVRSLVSCVFAALFFSAVLVSRPGRRLFLILIAAPLALAMNFFRSLLLTLLVNWGVRINGVWHDATGYAVLGLTAAMLGGLALALATQEGPKGLRSGNPKGPSWAAPLAATFALAASAALMVFFEHNTRPEIRHGTPPPDLDALLPEEATGWKVSTRHDLYQFEGTLRTDHLAERSYVRMRPDGLEQITLYVAYWLPGQAPVSLVSMHTPDACWPGTGWAPQQTFFTQERPEIRGAPLPLAEYRLFRNQGFPQYVWFWHLYDGRPIAFENPYSAAALLRIAWTYGFRHDGDQLFVRISSNRPWAEIQGEPFLNTFYRRVHALGL